MFWYVLLFQYGDVWHIYCLCREQPYDKADERERTWLANAANAAVDWLNLRKDGCNVIKEAVLFPLLLNNKKADFSKIELPATPVDAIADIRLSCHAADSTRS